jgi:serine/threonine-protein kinase
LVAQARGNIDAARHAFEAAGRVVEADLRQWPDDAKGIMMLAMIHAALGRKEEALQEGRRATELLPLAKDAYDGPILATNLAAIYAEVGELDRAIEQLTPLLKLPNGPTSALLRVEPEWDPLRGDARFEKLAGG